MLPSRVTIIVAGRVQGVGFRWFTQQCARALGVTGTVRNLPDGRVEAVAEGGREALTDLIEELRRGPGSVQSGARVDGLEAIWGAAIGTEPGFRIIG